MPYNTELTKAVILRCTVCPWAAPHIGAIITTLKYLCPKCGNETEVDGGKAESENSVFANVDLKGWKEKYL